MEGLEKRVMVLSGIYSWANVTLGF
jgi:hypothetical protein